MLVLLFVFDFEVFTITSPTERSTPLALQEKLLCHLCSQYFSLCSETDFYSYLNVKLKEIKPEGE